MLVARLRWTYRCEAVALGDSMGLLFIHRFSFACSFLSNFFRYLHHVL